MYYTHVLHSCITHMYYTHILHTYTIGTQDYTHSALNTRAIKFTNTSIKLEVGEFEADGLLAWVILHTATDQPRVNQPKNNTKRWNKWNVNMWNIRVYSRLNRFSILVCVFHKLLRFPDRSMAVSKQDRVGWLASDWAGKLMLVANGIYWDKY